MARLVRVHLAAQARPGPVPAELERKESFRMQFRHLRPSDLHGSTDLPGLDAWLNSLGPLDTVLLILAPPGTGKAAAVGAIAEKLEHEVVLCDLLQTLDYPDADHQLHNLLVACESHQKKVIYLDKVDRLIESWD